MASTEDLRQHRFPLNNGSGEIPALGFETSPSDNKRRTAPSRPRSRWDSATSTPPSGTATKPRSARHSQSYSLTGRCAARTCL
jgi:hypothetical protein